MPGSVNWTPKQLAARNGQAAPHKYNARKKEVDGILFDSTREANRYSELKILKEIGAIVNLELQPRFLLQEKFTDATGFRHRKITYVADFRYRIAGDNCDTVEDCKGYETEAFKLKWKLATNKYPDLRFTKWR